jgi:hypothetical protein
MRSFEVATIYLPKKTKNNEKRNFTLRIFEKVPDPKFNFHV